MERVPPQFLDMSPGCSIWDWSGSLDGACDPQCEGAGKKGEEMAEAVQEVQSEVLTLEKEEAELLTQLARVQASLSAARARKVSHKMHLAFHCISDRLPSMGRSCLLIFRFKQAQLSPHLFVRAEGNAKTSNQAF